MDSHELGCLRPSVWQNEWLRKKEYVPKKIEKGKNQLEKYHLHRILNLFDAFYLSDVLNTLETVFTKVYVHCTRQIS